MTKNLSNIFNKHSLLFHRFHDPKFGESKRGHDLLSIFDKYFLETHDFIFGKNRVLRGNTRKIVFMANALIFNAKTGHYFWCGWNGEKAKYAFT